MNKSKQEKWNLLSAVMFIVSSVMIYLGYDKIANYYSNDVSSLSKNSYVGGDAYNYIINGTRSISFFVLATMFAILGVSFIMIGYLDKISNIRQSERIINLLEGLNENSGTKNDNLNNTLPPL